MIGETLSHYRIVGKVGAGGMGVVYRAHDPRLDRDVAIKIMPGAASRDSMQIERFQREARAAGALNDPNVLSIYDVGTHEGVPYIVTELLEGSNLRDRMVAGNITQKTALGIASKIAGGLAAAHARRIVHRDLKPANVFITRDGHVKILDFGLAKLMRDIPPDATGDAGSLATAAETEDLHTDDGVVVGTPGYMAPEVLSGDAADHRSDIFSLGVIMYELLAGNHPFRGQSQASMLAAILRDDPAPFDETSPQISPALENIVLRCLEKRPEDRFESAHDLAIALEALTEESVTRYLTRRPPNRRRTLWPIMGVAVIVSAVCAYWLVTNLGGPPLLPEEKRIVVLPFDSLTGNQELQELAGGVSMTVFDGLTMIEDGAPGRLWVISGESADEHGPKIVAELRRENNVNLAIAGSVDLDSETIRLRLQVLDTQTGDRLRSESIETSVGNLTTLQHDLTPRVAEMLGFTVEPELINRLEQSATNVTAAYLPYLKGRGALASSAEDNVGNRTIELLQESVAADPMFTHARVALAEAWLLKFENGEDPAALEEGLRQSEAAAGFGSHLPETYLVLGSLYEAAGRDDETLQALEKAVSVSPNRAGAFLKLGEAFRRRQRYEEAETAFERAINLRPSWWYGYRRLAALHLEKGEYDAAAIQFRRVTELTPENPEGFSNLGTLYYYLDRHDDAEEMYLRSVEIKPLADAYSNLGTLAFEDARYGDAAEHLVKAVELGAEEYGIWGNLASAYYWGGERNMAESAYRRALELGEVELDHSPTDPDLPAVLAGYCGMLGEQERGLQLIETAIALGPENKESMATIAESLEDLGERERALEWILRALDAELTPAWIARRPGLRDLASDPRYRAMINARNEQTGIVGS